MSLNYNLLDTLKLFELSIKNNMFISIFISVIILEIIFYINKNKSFVRYTILILNIVALILILYYYLGDLLSFEFSNPINNIYFYFLNSIIYLLIFTIMTFKFKYKKSNYIIYGFVLINLYYCLFMTYYFKNQTLIVIANIFHMVKFGNIIYIIYYINYVIFLLLNLLRKR